LRILIERARLETPAAGGAGVTLDDCVRVSRDLSTMLDLEDPIEQAYALEVSSPGLDRPLRQIADFQRHIGSLAKLKLAEPALDGQSVLRGTIQAAANETVTINVDGNDHGVALANIKQAKLIVDFGTTKQPNRASKRAKGARRKQRKG